MDGVNIMNKDSNIYVEGNVTDSVIGHTIIQNAPQKEPEKEEDESLREFFPQRDDTDRPFPGERLGTKRKKLQDVFVETEFFRQLKTTLLEQGTVILTGPPGDGKTTMAVMMCKSLEEEGYTAVYNESVETVNVDAIAKTEKSVFLVIDNTFGRSSFSRRKSEITQQILSKVRELQARRKLVGGELLSTQAGPHGQNTKKPTLLLILFRDRVYKEAEANVRWLSDFACNHSTKNSLTQDEKKKMLSKHGRKAQKTISEDELDSITRMVTPFGFPLMCRLYALFAPSEGDPVKFFGSRLAALRDAVSLTMNTKPMNKLALALMVLEESVYLLHLEDPLSQRPQHLDESLEAVAKELNAGEPVPHLELAKCLRNMCGGLLELNYEYVDFNFDNAREAVMLALAENHIAFVARRCSLDFINDYILLAADESRPVKDEYKSDTKIVPRRQWKLFSDRLLEEMNKGNLHGVFVSSLVNHPAFLDLVLGSLVNSRQYKEIVRARDQTGLSFLFWVSMTSFSKFHIFAQVAFTDDEIWEALCGCCAKGHASQVKHLYLELSSPPEWTKPLCTRSGYVQDRMNFSLNTSPVLEMNKSIPGTIAAAHGHVEVLKTLLELKMPVDVQNTFGETPFMLACGGGHTKLVELLLERGADVTVSDRTGCNALHWAVWFNCTEEADTLIRKAKAEEVIDALDNPNTLEGTPLMLACWKSPRLARFLIACGVDTTLRDGQGRTCLHYASSGDDPDLVQEMIELYDMDVNAVDKRGFSPLHQACARPGNHKAVSALLDAGADPNLRATVTDADIRPAEPDPQARSIGVAPLHVACTNEVEIVKLLLEKGVEIDAPDEANHTPIIYACNYGKADIVGFLLRQNANARLRDSDDNTILHYASEFGGVSLAESILEIRPEMLNAKNRKKLTPLCVACWFGNTDVVRFLISRDAETEKSDENGGNVLHVSSAKGQLPVVKCLVEEVSIDVDSRDKRLWTPLMLACFFGRLRVIIYLLRNSADIHCVDENGNTLMHLVAANGNSAALLYVAGQKRMKVDVKRVTGNEKSQKSDSETDYVQSLRQVSQAEVSSSTLDRYGNSPLHHAAAGGNLNIIKYLLDEEHINVDERNEEGNTSFLMGSISGQKHVLKRLVDRGADPKATDQFGNTAVHHGSGEGHLEVLEYLVEELKLNVNEVNKSGETPLGAAKRRKRENVYDFLYRHGAVESLPNKHGETPLHTAAKAGDIPVAKYILDHGNVHVDCKNEKNETPLHCASACGQTEMVKFLIDKGASIYAECNDCNHLPVHLAVMQQRLASTKVLLEKDPRTIDAACTSGRTPMCHGCESVDVKTSELAKYLIEFDKASKHRKNGDTSVHVAARGGHTTTVQVLVEKVQMKVGVKNDKRETPLDCARAAGHSEIVTYLEKKASQSS